MAQWYVSAKKADFEGIGKKFGISPVLARLIINRDVIGEEDIRKYLYGDMGMLHDPFLMKDMEKAAELLVEKIGSGEKIRVIGDYDVDGICSAYILVRGLKALGADVDAAIAAVKVDDLVLPAILLGIYHYLIDHSAFLDEVCKSAYRDILTVYIQVDVHLAFAQFERLFQGRDLDSGLYLVILPVHVKFKNLGIGLVRNLSGTICRPVYSSVVHQNQHSVLRRTNIQFDHIHDSRLDGSLNDFQRVLRQSLIYSLLRICPMSDYEHFLARIDLVLSLDRLIEQSHQIRSRLLSDISRTVVIGSISLLFSTPGAPQCKSSREKDPYEMFENHDDTTSGSLYDDGSDLSSANLYCPAQYTPESAYIL